MGTILPGTLPGATIGILGGGQLGRMAAMAARTLGYQVHALDPDPACAARGVVDRLVVAPFDDPRGAAELAASCQVVTLEIEKIAPASMAAAQALAPLRPGGEILKVVQDRALQKQWLARRGFPVGPFRVAESAEALQQAVRDLGGTCFIKSRTGGYDGRGQIRVERDAASPALPALHDVWAEIGPCVVEEALDLEVELSVLVARSPGGEMAVYPPARNHHEQRILDWSVIPGPFPAAAVARAQEMARDIAAAILAEGLLAVEIFLLRDGTMLVNELSPRPHNTFHGTFLACLTDQFEQLVRAVCDLPLGSVEVVRPAAIVNLLGDLWLRPSRRPPAFARALALPGVRLHLYGKGPARPGRKMGHLSAVGQTPSAALDLVLQARSLL